MKMTPEDLDRRVADGLALENSGRAETAVFAIELRAMIARWQAYGHVATITNVGTFAVVPHNDLPAASLRQVLDDLLGIKFEVTTR